jgi:hypothetical protein
VIDESREADLQRAYGKGPVPGVSFVLSWGGRVIPMDVVRRQVHNPDSAPYLLSVFQTFGFSPAIKFRAGIKSFSFSSADEEHTARMLAVEALLVFGGNYDGLERPDGYNRVAFEGHEWILSDFGYPLTKNGN